VHPLDPLPLAVSLGLPLLGKGHTIGHLHMQTVPALAFHVHATLNMEREDRESLQVEMTKNVSPAEELEAWKESGWVGGGGGAHPLAIQPSPHLPPCSPLTQHEPGCCLQAWA